MSANPFIPLHGLEKRWKRLAELMERELSQPNITTESLLLLIGIRELGWAPRNFTKEEKINLIHVGTCSILTPAGYYTLAFTDGEGWPHYDLAAPLPELDIFSQVLFIKQHLILYLEEAFALHDTQLT